MLGIRAPTVFVFICISGSSLRPVCHHHGPYLHPAPVRRSTHVPDYARIQKSIQRRHTLAQSHPQHEQLVPGRYHRRTRQHRQRMHHLQGGDVGPHH